MGLIFFGLDHSKPPRLPNIVAAVVGGVAGVGLGLLIVTAFPVGPYVAIAVPLGICLIASVVVARRSRSPLIRSAAGGFAFACVAQLGLYAGAG